MNKIYFLFKDYEKLLSWEGFPWIEVVPSWLFFMYLYVGRDLGNINKV